jgi:hypothetical protein
MIKSTFVRVISVRDPDTLDLVEIEIRKLETGAMMGIDGSYLEQDVGKVYSPYDKNVEIDVDND